MDFKEGQVAEAAKKSEEENQKRAQMMQFVQYLEAEHARKEQLKQRALEFAESLKLDQAKFTEQKRYNDERLNISRQKLAGPSTGGGGGGNIATASNIALPEDKEEVKRANEILSENIDKYNINEKLDKIQTK